VIGYEIRDASGLLVAIHERRDQTDGSKTFIWRQPDGTSGLGGLPVVDLPLYGIERLDGLASTVVVTEGEKTAEALWTIGVPAVGTVTGASTIPGPTILADLNGRQVILWPDADAIGRKHMARIAERLAEVAASVSVVEPPDGVPGGWDAADAVAEGRKVEALLAGPLTPSLAEALAQVESFLRRYVAFARPEAIVAAVLWVGHTYALEYADATPYLAITSPEKQSGKTRLLECLVLLARGCTGILITPTASTLYRTLEAMPDAALLLDELDATFRDHSDRYEEVRAVINAGHRRGATVPRSVLGPKSTWVVKQFPVFGPKALAGIGKLPDTIADRAIPIRMLKRKRSERVARFHDRAARSEAAPIVKGLVAALAAEPPAFEAMLPLALPDRAADAWEPLFALADVAGGPWPTRARSAAVILHTNREQDDSLGLRLLADIRLVFVANRGDRISTADLIAALRSDDESPWASDRDPLTPHRLGRLLRPFQISSKQARIDGGSLKAYEREAFLDSWERYLAEPQSSSESKQRNTDHEGGFGVSDATPSDAGGGSDLADLPIESEYPRSAWDPDAGLEEAERVAAAGGPVR
jgi:hypothetical protein